VPNYFGSFWANYSVDAGALDGLTLGGGVRFVGASFGDDANILEAPAYEIFDTAMSYDLGEIDPMLAQSDLTINVSNVFDKEYYSSCSSNFYCEFGNRRTYLVGVRHRW
jgi:iron complex outermembrane receptor protein